MTPALSDVTGLTAAAAGLPLDTSSAAKDARKATGAAKDFEAILIGQMLHSLHDADSGWLGTDDDDADATAIGFGEEELAKALTAGGGFGLAKVIAAGLTAKSAAAEAASSTQTGTQGPESD